MAITNQIRSHCDDDIVVMSDMNDGEDKNKAPAKKRKKTVQTESEVTA